MIITFSKEHVDAVSALHLNCLTGLLCELGIGAIRAFYLGASKSERTVAYVYIENDRVLGFVLGSTRPAKLRKEILKKQFLQTLMGTLMGVFRQPGLLGSMLSSWVDRSDNFDRGEAELIYLAVDGKQRSKGVGKQLIEAFEQDLKKSDAHTYELSVDVENEAAKRFYIRLGFKKTGDYQEFGTEHYRFRKVLA